MSWSEKAAMQAWDHADQHTRAANAPHLALVLGSGGVRSVAALGIAEVLVNAGLEPDLVVGCSSGALFGACIAMGLTGEQGLAAARQLWSAELTQQKRWSAYLELLAPRFMGFDAGFSLRDARADSRARRARVRRRAARGPADPAARGGDRGRHRRFGGAHARPAWRTRCARAWRCRSSFRAWKSMAGGSAMA